MKITRISPDETLTFSTTGEDRAPGLHLSDIIKRVMFEREKRFNPETPIDMMALERGHTWEEVLAHALQRRFLAANREYRGHRPTPFQYDGVWMSPDWLDPDSEWPVEEWKATKTSSKKALAEHHWYWLPQVQGYIKGLQGTGQIPAGCTKARYRVWYVNGDYSWEAKTSDLHLLREYARYDVEFTQREIDDNWRSLLGYAKRYGLLTDAPQEEDETACPTRKRKPSNPPPAPSRPASAKATSRTSRTSLKSRDAS